MARINFEDITDDIVAKFNGIEIRPKKFEGSLFCVEGTLSKIDGEPTIEKLLALKLSLLDTEMMSFQTNSGTSFTVYLQKGVKEQLASYDGSIIKIVFKVLYGIKELLSEGLFLTEDIIGYELVAVKKINH